MRQSQFFQYAGLHFEIQRKAFRRGLQISIYPDQPVRIKVGLLTPLHKIKFVLDEKLSWIQKNVEKLNALSSKNKIELSTNTLFPLFGEDVLQLSSKIENNPAHIRKMLHQVYKKQAQEYLPARVQYWSEKMQLSPKKLNIRGPRSRWGSCTADGHVMLNYKLMIFSKEMIDYVIVHELAHLAELNHSAKFWNLVRLQLPEYKTTQKNLKQSQLKASFLDKN